MKDMMIVVLVIAIALVIWTNYVDRGGEVVPTPVVLNTPIPYQPVVEPTWTPFYQAQSSEDVVLTATLSPSLNQALGNPDGTNPFLGEIPNP